MAEAESLETAAEHERILREIESTDTACIGPTLRYPPGTGATDGRVRAGRGPGSFGAVCLAGRPQGQRQPPVSGIPASDLHPGQGGSASTARTWGPYSTADAHSPVTPEAPLAFLQAGAALVLPPRPALSWATRARPADGGF